MTHQQQVIGGSEVSERLGTLVTNANAVRAIASAVEGTLGPKGLDTMLVDKFGGVVITNDGVTILAQMEANHPAARMLINIAKAQQEEIGDGTTTATIMAGAMVDTGVELISRGVPVARVIEGLRAGLKRGLELMKEKARPVERLDDPAVRQVALVAGRGREDIADLAVRAAFLIGEEKLREPSFKLADLIIAQEGVDNQVFSGVVITKERLNHQMPRALESVKTLVIDDALEPEEIEDEALSTESGFACYLELQNQFRENIRKIIELQVGLVLVGKGVNELAEEMLTDASTIVVQRVRARELCKAAEHTGARMIKRIGLKKGLDQLERYLGRARSVFNDEKLEQIWICEGAGKPMATAIVGAATTEVLGERERIARDAAAAVQAAIKGGIVPGSGALEIAVMHELEKLRTGMRGMAAYGVNCVVEALKRPLAQIVANAGFNSLEKVGAVITAQLETKNDALAIDCDTGEVCDMYQVGIIDPLLVKTYALKAAGEVAEAILRIDTIIKKREEKAAEKKETIEYRI